MVHLRRLHEAYGERVVFLFVAIREATHALPEEIARDVDRPAAPDEPDDHRRRLLVAGLKHYKLTIPCLLDTADAEVEKKYGAFPLRVVLVDVSGHIVLASGANAPPDRWDGVESWLKEQPQPADRAH